TVLSIEDKLNYLEQPIPPAPVVSAEHELLQTTRYFHSCKQEEGQLVSSYVLKMKGYIDNLKRLGHPVTLGLGASLILIGLRKEFDGFVQNYNMHSLGKTINKLHAMLKLHKQTLPKNNAPILHAIRAGKVQKVNKHKKSQPQLAARGKNHEKRKNKLAYAPKPKIPPPPKREDPAKDSTCHKCGETGHWKRNCPLYLAELLKNTTLGAGGSGIFVLELNTILNRSWINDIGCGTHICNTTQGLRASRKLKPGALSLYVGNGQCETVESLLFHSFVSFVSSNHIIPNMWRYRLRHISKKRIEKLQHDGLLNSTDLRAFENCVSCMFGKMERKPYTHQVERAKDLLGLIHTNVCGPFKIMSRQRANYFVTFIDDFSCYGYVYLLKHKHEVFETFKVFQKEVENQLGYPKETMGYSFYYPPENKVLVAQNAEFLENSLITQEASGSLEDLEIIQEEDTHPSIDTSLNHEENDQEIDKPQNAEDHELGDIGKPTNYKAALLDPESEKWLNAMNVEMQSMKDNEVWVLVELPPNGKTVEVYMEQPEGFVNPKYPNRVCKLKHSIYGLKQASRHWNKRFDDEIKKFGFTQNHDVPCVYLKASGSNITFLILYVDDILIIGNNIPMLQDAKSYLGRCFAMKDLGEAAYILRTKIYRDRSRRLIGLCQSAYIEKILKRYCMENSKRGSIPMQEKLKLSKSQGALTPAELKRMNTKDMFLVYDGDLKRELKSAKQSIFATSSAEAEYIDAFDASKEAVWVRKFISGLGIVPTIKEPTSMYCDNTRAIAIANESGITKGARYFRAKVHYLRKVIEYGDVKLKKVHTDDNLADPFTKALTFPKRSEHTRNFGMLPASSLM
nr:hypothetical protein [Tanacetum cinerariifolium]